jgi:hypothetical protein
LTRWLRGLSEYPFIRSGFIQASWWFSVAGVALVAAWVVGEIEFAPGVPLGLSILFLCGTVLAWAHASPFSRREPPALGAASALGIHGLSKG